MTLPQATGLPTGAPQQPAVQSRQQRQQPQYAYATSTNPRARRTSQTAAKAGGIPRRPVKQPSGKPAAPAAAAATSLHSHDVHRVPRRRSVRLTKEQLEVPDVDATAAAASRSVNAARNSPEGGSLGARAGRQFTVGSIGNNGRIYLRCVLLTAHHRNLF
jgi:hypothetical protein